MKDIPPVLVMVLHKRCNALVVDMSHFSRLVYLGGELISRTLLLAWFSVRGWLWGAGWLSSVGTFYSCWLPVFPMCSSFPTAPLPFSVCVRWSLGEPI